MTTSTEQLREEWKNQFPKYYPIDESDREDIADWWLSKLSSILAEKVEKVKNLHTTGIGAVSKEDVISILNEK